MRRYHIQGRDDYKKYQKIAGMITKLVSSICPLRLLHALNVPSVLLDPDGFVKPNGAT